MWPTLISIGPVAIHSFGVFVALGVFFGGFVLWQKGREEGFEEEGLMDAWLVALLVALVVSRLVFVLLNWETFSGSAYKMMFLTKFPGLSGSGAFLGGLLSLWITSIRKKWDSWSLLEISVFSFLMMGIFGWVGNFLAGSTLGKTTNLFWGLSFPGVIGKRHPVQLLWILVLMGIYWLLKKWEKKYRSFSWYQQSKDEAKTGFLLASYLMILGLAQLVLGLVTENSVWWFGAGLILIGSLILVNRSGIKIELVKSKNVQKEDDEVKLRKPKLKRKKKGFDFK